MQRSLRRLLVAMLFVAVGCHKRKASDSDLPQVAGSRVGSFESRTLPPFSRILVGGALELTVNVGKNAPLELRGEDNLFAHVPARVVDGELRLEPDAVLKTTQPFRLTVGTERLDAVSAAVSTKVTVHAVKSDAFAVKAGGAARVVIDGSATTLSVAARSVAQVDLSAFSAGKASVSAADFSRVRLGYLEELDATQRGTASIAYHGTPAVTRHAERPSAIGSY